MSKSWRLLEIAAEICGVDGVKVEMLNLSRLGAEYGKHIHPCKACFSTAAALCHWPCSCYPNYSLGQTQDMMNEIYPLWVRAHGIMLITPVNWYHTSSPMKLMIDRLVCADGGNPDPDLDPRQGRAEGQAARAGRLALSAPSRRAGCSRSSSMATSRAPRTSAARLADWLRFMHLVPAGVPAELDRYIGYWEPYATSHEALDKDEAIQEEVRNAARTLLEAVQARRAGRLVSAGNELEQPRQK